LLWFGYITFLSHFPICLQSGTTQQAKQVSTPGVALMFSVGGQLVFTGGQNVLK